MILNGLESNDDYAINSKELKLIEDRRKAALNGEEKTYSVTQVKKKLLKDLGK